MSFLMQLLIIKDLSVVLVYSHYRETVCVTSFQ